MGPVNDAFILDSVENREVVGEEEEGYRRLRLAKEIFASLYIIHADAQALQNSTCQFSECGLTSQVRTIRSMLTIVLYLPLPSFYGDVQTCRVKVCSMGVLLQLLCILICKEQIRMDFNELSEHSYV